MKLLLHVDLLSSGGSDAKEFPNLILSFVLCLTLAESDAQGTVVLHGILAQAP